MNAQPDHSLAERWSQNLGLALSKLFGNADAPFSGSRHYALLDGVTASFCLSLADQGELPNLQDATSYAWSSNVRKHVMVDQHGVSVVSVARPNQVEKYPANRIENQLESFLDYLSGDRQLPNISVVEHVLGVLDHYRGLANERGLTDDIALSSLLLDVAASSTRSENFADTANKFGLHHVADATPLIEQVRNSHRFDGGAIEKPALLSGLAIRHAGGAIFQRVTAELTVSPQRDLFRGLLLASTGRPQSLTQGGYFTPPGLARSLSEAGIASLLRLPRIRICDPACGSGAFLSEVLRALERAHYIGEIVLVGRDINPTAVTIANFVVQSAKMDFNRDSITIDIRLADSLTADAEGPYDLVLMNPPFRSWEQCSNDQREIIRHILGRDLSGKPDLSLAFAEKALVSLADGGVLATLLPIGVLTADYSRPWRARISETTQIDLVGALGDHHIFDYALVNVATLVTRKIPPSRAYSHKTMMLWANQDARASSNALRDLRKFSYAQHANADAGELWRTYLLSQFELTTRSNWAPTAFGREGMIEVLRGRFPPLGKLFKVHQGIRTGSRDAFVISEAEFRNLPPAEQAAFRPVAEKDDISKLSIDSRSYVFYADNLDDPITGEEEFKRRFPTYFESKILPNKSTLSSRPRGVNLWSLSWSRSWLRRPEPKIVSRMFIGRRQLGFAVDHVGHYAIVQGYGWVPVWKEIGPRLTAETKLKALYVYSFLFASEIFFDMVRTVSVNIAGGQFDLAPKYIDSLPVPTWSAIEAAVGPQLSSMAAIYQLRESFLAHPAELERFARSVFQTDLAA